MAVESNSKVKQEVSTHSTQINTEVNVYMLKYKVI